jgi:hypothetical protein
MEGGMRRLAMVILWPSFLVAAMAEGFFFSLLDPSDVHLGGMHLPLQPVAAYSLGFLMFWVCCALACMLSYYLANVPGGRDPPLYRGGFRGWVGGGVAYSRG